MNAHSSVHDSAPGRAGPLHRIDPAAKLLGALLFVAFVAATPRDQVWAYAVHAAVVASVAAIGRVPAARLLRGAALELPFVGFALLLPVVGRSPHVDVAGISLSEPGLWAAWSIVAKGTLGATAATLLAATTSVPQLLDAMRRLRVPALVVGVTGFMVRYVDVVADDARRMRIARLSRCHDPRWLWQARAVASSAGALFVRSYERGERVHLAMRSRGYEGTMPRLARERAGGSWWSTLPAAVAMGTCVTAWLLR